MSAPHPAKFTDSILATIQAYTQPGWRVLDPFAGTGRVHLLSGLQTVGVELEPEWAVADPRTMVGDALALPFKDQAFDCIITSPTYGSRMADHHDAKDDSKRITYRHSLGRPLHPNNSGQLQWGQAYRDFHKAAWCEAIRVLKRDGRFILNISNHIRRGKEQDVCAFHAGTLIGYGMRSVLVAKVPTPRMKFGQNAGARVDHEMVMVFERAN